MSILWQDFKSAFNKPNNGLMQLIYINIAVFVIINIFKLISFFTQNSIFYDIPSSLIFLPGDISVFIFKPWTIISYFFTQEGFFHILFNMMGLYYFGRIIDDLIGNDRLIGIYIWSGIAGGLAFLLAYNLLGQYSNVGTILIGSSGSVFGIAVAAATLAPEYNIFMVFLGPVKLIWVVAVYVFVSLIGTMGTNAGGNIAHLGGALMGYLFIKSLHKGIEINKPVLFVLDFFRNFSKPKSKIKVTYRSTPTNKSKEVEKSSGFVSQQEIDTILDKISASGYESLTKEEKQKLFSASQKK